VRRLKAPPLELLSESKQHLLVAYSIAPPLPTSSGPSPTFFLGHREQAAAECPVIQIARFLPALCTDIAAL
jgi:hypothetical protein